jgi:hypothetical protein
MLSEVAVYLIGGSIPIWIYDIYLFINGLPNKSFYGEVANGWEMPLISFCMAIVNIAICLVYKRLRHKYLFKETLLSLAVGTAALFLMALTDRHSSYILDDFSLTLAKEFLFTTLLFAAFSLTVFLYKRLSKHK